MDYYIFGSNLFPHPTTKAGKEALKTRHKNILDLLFIKRDIKHSKGYQFYSWKDTGAGDIIESLGAEVAQIQYGHKKIETTMRYVKKDRVNEKMLKFKGKIVLSIV